MLVGSVYNLDIFENCSFDVVFTRGVIMHINHEKIKDVLYNMRRIAKYHIINIERHGKNKIMSYGSDKTPHAFSHDFINAYKSIGISANIKNMFDLTKKEPKGGAEHFIWADLTTKKLYF